MIARVIVDIKHKEVNQIYDYIIPDELANLVQIGMRILVPFGPQKRMGIIVSFTSDSSFATKEIISLLDVEPTIDPLLFDIIDYLDQNPKQLMVSLFETVVPKQLWLNYKKVATLLKPDLLLDEEIKANFNKKNIWVLRNKDSIYYSKLIRLRDEKIIEFRTIYEPREKEVSKVYLTTGPITKKLTSLQQFAYDTLANEQPMLQSELIAKTTNSVVKTLIKNRIILTHNKKISRSEVHNFSLDDKDITLTTKQEAVVNSISKKINQYQTFLLKGITASGKTEVYLKLIDLVLDQNKQVLILVPEIMLVAPMLQRFMAKYPDKEIVTFHSALNSGIKYDSYQKVKKNHADIVIGTRSAIFLPLDNLGIIIIDEEHDSSYIQTEPVYYKTHEIAIIKAQHFDIPLILGSATPTIESMFKANNNEYKLLTLDQKAVYLPDANVYISDMREELKNGNTSILSTQLKAAIDQALLAKQQIMLLINQKGFAPFVMCRNCGYVPKDPETQTSLVYYKAEEKLKSKYTKYQEPFTKVCSVCGAEKIREVGYGSEYVEQRIKEFYPKAKVLRIDADTTRLKGTHERYWQSFLNNEADILVGTQMIAKGLDFPNLTVVGILMADASLKVSAYDANEKTFMLITQALGRSGRHQQGSVFIQTYDPENQTIQAAAKNDYDTFYKEALYQRKLLKLPPYGIMNQVLIEGEQYLKSYQYAFLIKKRLEENDFEVLGPIPSYFMMLNDKYRFIITIKYQKQTSKLKEIIDEFDDPLYKVSFHYYPNLQ